VNYSGILPETPKQAARRLAEAAIKGEFTPEALHTYTDPRGETIYWRIRARLADGSKWLRPMRLNGKGYELGEPEFPSTKPLYGLHELSAKPGAPVWYVEGENCVNALAALGVLATTAAARAAMSARNTQCLLSALSRYGRTMTRRESATARVWRLSCDLLDATLRR
jgi:hypothetical protein